MSGILRRAFWPTSSDHSNRPSNNENVNQYISPSEYTQVQNANNTVSFTGWDDHSAPMDEDCSFALPNSSDQRSWTPLNNHSGAWANHRGIIGESNSVITSGDVDEVPMEDEIGQSGLPTNGEMGDWGAPTIPSGEDREPTGKEVNEGMPGFLIVGEPPELFRARSTERIEPNVSHSQQEGFVLTTLTKRTRNDEPETQVCFIIMLKLISPIIHPGYAQTSSPRG